MGYSEKIKVKISYGGGFNLLCLAGAGALFVKAVNMMADGIRAKERHEIMKDLKEKSDTMVDLAEFIANSLKKDDKKENADVEKTEE